MVRKATNRELNAAKAGKNDEFYTRLPDIERELKHYKAHFRGKVVFCNCDDPWVSNFFVYFSQNFQKLKLKKLITTCYKNSQPNMFSEHKSEKAVWLEYTGDKDGDRVPSPEEIGIKRLKGDGDFRSAECIELLKQADIVVTNPPFSLFREYVAQLVKYDKKFLAIGTWNAITYKGIFNLIKEDKLWIGINSNRNFSGFIVPKHYPLHGTEARVDENGNRIVSSNNTCWFTNLDIAKRHEDLVLYKKYDPTEYPKYDNYDAIEVSKTNDIPMDYAGVMGVPVTFLDKFNPEQFEILGSNRIVDQDPTGVYGQQRTISVGQYVNGDFSFDKMYFHNLPKDKQKQILDYNLMVYLCSGTDSERLDWFRTINIAGEKLTDQELLNAVYAGPWTADAKRYFSKTGCPAYGLASDYVNGSPIRQDYLETAIDWISNGKIKDYMSKHQHDPQADALWRYFQDVISWVKTIFPVYRREMKVLPWGTLYNTHKDKVLDPKKLEKRLLELIDDDGVQSVKGIYPYLLTGDERTLNLRQFDEKTKRKVYERQKGVCIKCKKHFEFAGMEADHVKPWHEGGKTEERNCQLLCKDDNRRKSGR